MPTAVPTKVFISYSRVDLDFVRGLAAALEARGFETLIDLSGIAPSEKWWSRIKDLITQCEAVVFVLSPDAINSKVCQDEIDCAVALNKRLVPIVARPVAASDV